MIRLTSLVAVTTVLFAPCAIAQAPKAFEIVSIKVNRSGERGFSTGGLSGGRYNARNIPGKILVAQAFGVRENQIAGAPNWLENERYDIVARSSSNATPNQLKQFLQAMLTDRMKLMFRREMREIPGYALVVAKGGPKMKPNGMKPDSGGQPPDLNSSSNRAGAKISATKMPLSALAKQLEGELECPVADKTGLTGNYDFQLEWTHQEGAGDENPSLFAVVQEHLGLKYPSIFTAVQEQLGLKLNAVKKAPAEVIVIEGIEHASEN